MPDYKEMYLRMVRKTEKSVTRMEQALNILIAAQRECEEMYINAPDPIIKLSNLNTEKQQMKQTEESDF